MADESLVDAIEVNWKGKTYLLLEADAQAIRQQVCSFVSSYVDILDRTMKTNLKVHEGYLETAQLRNGYLKAVSQMIVMKVADVRFPDTGLSARASSALSKVRGVLSEKKLVALGAALQEAETAINAYCKDVDRFLKELGASAHTTGTVLTVTTSAGFAVLGSMGAGMLVVGGFASTTAAAAISGASVKVLQSGAEEFGRYLDGQDVSAFESVQKVVIDAAVGAATGSIASKIDAKLFMPMAQEAAKQVANRLTFLASDQALRLLTNFLNSSGQAIVVSAATEAVEYLGAAVKKGQTPTEDDLRKSFEKFLIGALTGGIMKNLELGEDRMMVLAAKAFETKIGTEAIKRLAAGTTVSSSDAAKISIDTFKALTEDVGKSGVNAIVASASGDESADKLATLGMAGIEKDANLKRLIDAEIKKQLQKRKIAVK